ncbi:cell wall hydrolase [Paenibacillus sacheonensis]|uniref:Cell wall hydrolase n=1 Tax=Paenibacillus sacheonensis TaxID=742054 RepID=A0A7X4YLI2_9BACL|nr:cell wall hydrolase [Paenibacillus sacheonensis]MBM7564003.1 LysM repeat protein [Paenibacillus sacheonensis]NBC67659.1 cell wall hydrolase [Paenibacillus sacheonensis]
MNRESKLVRKPIIVIVIGLLLLCFGPMSVASAGQAVSVLNPTIQVNGKTVKLNSRVFNVNGRIYVPAARVAQLFGAKTSWNNMNEELTIHTALNDQIVIGNGVPVVYFNEGRYRMDARPFLKDERLYLPLRLVSEILHADLKVSADADVIKLTTVQPATVAADNGLDVVVQSYSVSKKELLNRNELAGTAEVKPGTKLRVIVPSFLDQPAKSFTDADLMLLAKITMVESGYEPYAGQLALANVILNRVKDPRFPDTIRDVIYSGRQFPPAHNGLLDKSKPNATSLRAAKDALNGKNNIGNALYFYNPGISKGAFWSSLDTVATIGHHRFAA